MLTIGQHREPRLVHEASVYSSDEEFLARLVPFVRDGVAAGEPVIVTVTPSNVALLRDALGREAKRVLFVDATRLYRRPAHAIAEYRRHLDAELSRPTAGVVRVVGEVQFGPTSEEHAEWTRYESVLNAALAGYPVWIVCPYDTRVLSEQVVADAHCTHPFVSTGDRRDRSAGYAETDELVEPPLIGKPEGAGGSREPVAQLTLGNERDFAGLRLTVAGTARAAGLSPTTVDDVTVAVAELVRDALYDGDGEASVKITRDGARWLCEVTDSQPTTPGDRVGLSIARLISDRVELASGPELQSVRLTFAGAEDARQRILDAASELFYQHGIRATGINSLISNSGVAKATFFKYFPAKDDLVLAWLQQPASRWFDRIRAELDTRSESPRRRLLTFFDLLAEWFARDDFRGCAFQNAAAETPDASDPVRQATHDYTLEIQEWLRETATGAGLPHPARTAEQLHLLAQGAIAGAVATCSPGTGKVARAAAGRLLKQT
jgi:AcrR family transcriptional regulator